MLVERYHMSEWTKVTGLVAVQVSGRTDKEKEYVLDSVLQHLPLVTGSEGPCHVMYVRAHGHNQSSSCDEFGNSSNLLPNEYGIPSRYGSLTCQDKYFVVLEGSLRDRTFEQTVRETCRWLCRLSSRLFVSYCNVDVFSTEGYSYSFNQVGWLQDNFVSGKDNWTYGLTWNWVELQDGTHTWNTLLGEEHALQSDS